MRDEKRRFQNRKYARDAFLFVHGQFGNRGEGEPFAEIAVPRGFQVLSVDLPEHNGRTDGVSLVPWEVVPELLCVADFLKNRWSCRNLRATSIGAWFSLLALDGECVEKSLLVSPLLDMEAMILSMMSAEGISEKRLEAEKEIVTPLGVELSWKYLCYAREHRVHAVGRETSILYGSNDAVIPLSKVEAFAKRENCRLTVADGCEHWFHTECQREILKKWETASLAERESVGK